MTDLAPTERTPIDKADRVQAQHIAGIVQAMMNSSERTYNQIAFFEGDYLVRFVVQYEVALIALEAREKQLTEALHRIKDGKKSVHPHTVNSQPRNYVEASKEDLQDWAREALEAT